MYSIQYCNYLYVINLLKLEYLYEMGTLYKKYTFAFQRLGAALQQRVLW